MGTTLTGTTPQDTYDSLIKVTDNGPLSGTAKYLSDGLGNDSALAVSTSAVGIGTSSPTGTYGKLTVQGNGITLGADGLGKIEIGRYSAGVPNSYIKLGSNSGSLRITNADDIYDIVVIENNTTGEKLRLTSAGNVGIGTSSPVARLDAVAAEAGTYTTSAQQVVARIYNSPSDLGSGVNSAFLSLQTTPNAGGNNPIARIGVVAEAYSSNAGAYVVATRNSDGSITEKIRVPSTGGITFNGDTAAANALDDYEEGTWTPVFRGATTAGSYGIGIGGGTYTKIGNQVTVYASLVDLFEASTGSGAWQISGLPYAIGSSDAFSRIASGTLYVRQSAVARTGLLLVSSPSNSSVFMNYSNGASDTVNYDIATDFLNNMDIGFVFTYTV